MGGETEQNISGWTVDTLHAHIFGLLTQHVAAIREIVSAHDVRYEQRFLAQEKATAAALLAAERAVAKAEAATEKRFDAVNEFRSTLADQARDLMPRLETEQSVKTLDNRIADVSKRLDIIANRIDSIKSQGAGREQAWGWVLGAVGLIGSAIAIAVVLVK